MKYILDFDRTLFDVEKLYQELEAIGKSEIAGTQESLSLIPMSDLLFPDVLDFFNEKNSDDIYILSSAKGLTAQWETDYQAAKIAATGIDAKVCQVRVVEGKKGAEALEIAHLFSSEETIVFVDDRLENCLDVKSVLPKVYCFLVIRDEVIPEYDYAGVGVSVVHTLTEVNDSMMTL
jgi:hypothetical protein